VKLETSKINSEITNSPLEPEKSNNSPLVTVNILSFNRKDELRNTLTKVYEQDYKNIEVIVVDNASLDGSPEMVEQEFPDVILIQMQKNIGIAGWNEGFKIAKGEYVLVLDDDSYPENDTIFSGVKIMCEKAQIAVVGFQIYNHALDIIENDEEKYKFSILSKSKGFIGCGALINSKVTKELRGFNDLIFLYHHEYEFSARVYNIGYEVVYASHKRVIHGYSTFNRNHKQIHGKLIDNRRYYYGFLSYTVFLFYNFNIFIASIVFVKLLVSNFLIAIKLNYYPAYIKAILNILIIIFKCLIDRKPLKKDIQKYYNYGNFKFYNTRVF